jgi:hypothetical protein
VPTKKDGNDLGSATTAAFPGYSASGHGYGQSDNSNANVWLGTAFGYDPHDSGNGRGGGPGTIGLPPGSAIVGNSNGSRGDGPGAANAGQRVILGGNVADTGLPIPTPNDLFNKKGKRVAGLTTLGLVPNPNGTVTLVVNSQVNEKILAAHPDLMDLEKTHVDLAEFWVREMNRTGRYPSALMKKFGDSPWDLATTEKIQAFLYESEYPDLLKDENWLDRDGGPHERPDFFK